MKNPVFGKTMENEIKLGGIKLVATERRRNHLVSETSFTENLLAIGMKKT